MYAKGLAKGDRIMTIKIDAIDAIDKKYHIWCQLDTTSFSQPPFYATVQNAGGGIRKKTTTQQQNTIMIYQALKYSY